MGAKELEDLQDLELQSELEKLQPYIDTTASKEDIIRQLEGCPICGSRLHFTYFADMVNLNTHEVANCNECGYRFRNPNHQLQ